MVNLPLPVHNSHLTLAKLSPCTYRPKTSKFLYSSKSSSSVSLWFLTAVVSMICLHFKANIYLTQGDKSRLKGKCINHWNEKERIFVIDNTYLSLHSSIYLSMYLLIPIYFLITFSRFSYSLHLLFTPTCIWPPLPPSARCPLVSVVRVRPFCIGLYWGQSNDLSSVGSLYVTLFTDIYVLFEVYYNIYKCIYHVQWCGNVNHSTSTH